MSSGCSRFSIVNKYHPNDPRLEFRGRNRASPTRGRLLLMHGSRAFGPRTEGARNNVGRSFRHANQPSVAGRKISLTACGVVRRPLLDDARP